MNKKILLIASATFLSWSTSHANITSTGPWSYGGGIYCYAALDAVNQTETITGSQWTSSGTMGVTLFADTTSDPILTIGNSINNTSLFAWTEYIVSVAMNQNFSINTASVGPPSGWTATITAPTGPDINGNYTGTIDYVGGTPVAINGTLDFGYVVQFTGSLQYSLTESVQAVPEPGTLGLLMVGGILIAGRALSKRR